MGQFARLVKVFSCRNHVLDNSSPRPNLESALAMSHFADTVSTAVAERSGSHARTQTMELQGAWVRLPCCDHAVHPVEIVSQHDGVVVVTRPGEPHADWVRFPDQSSMVALGWSDDEGTMGLFCNALGETEEGHWAFRVVSANQFAQRRRHVRVKTEANAQMLDTSLIRPVDMKLIDISESGMKCELVEFVPEQRVMPYQFAVRLEGSTLLLLAELRWSAKINPITYHAAFEFIEVHDDSLRRLRAHIMQQLARKQRSME